MKYANNIPTQFLISLLILSFWLWTMPTLAQSITPLQTDYLGTSSFYDIVQVDEDEYWAAGEHGNLFRINGQGEIERLPFPGIGMSILRVVPTEAYIFLTTDQGQIYRYDRYHGDFIPSSFSKEFSKLAFYDMVELKDGTLLVSGGHQKIAHGKKAIPKGFIAKVDPSLTLNPEIVWQHSLTFVWALHYRAEVDEVLASAFNGTHSIILSSVDEGTTFQRKQRLKGLVHQFTAYGNEIWYSGAKGIQYKKDGIIGRIGEDPMQMPGEGCIWSLIPLPAGMLGIAYNGAIVAPTQQGNYQFKIRPSQQSLYEAVLVSDTRALVVGHSGAIFMLDMGDNGVQPGMISLQYVTPE